MTNPETGGRYLRTKEGKLLRLSEVDEPVKGQRPPPVRRKRNAPVDDKE
jgi:hypothetical protein